MRRVVGEVGLLVFSVSMRVGLAFRYVGQIGVAYCPFAEDRYVFRVSVSVMVVVVSPAYAF